MMSLWDALRMNMMISYQELVRTFLNSQYLKIDNTYYYNAQKPRRIDNNILVQRSTHLVRINKDTV